MSIKYLLIALTTIVVSANAQTSFKSTIAVESITIPKDSIATVLDWFRIIENKGLVLSYNSSNINLKEKIKLNKQIVTINDFLDKILYKYDFNTNYVSNNKILLQIKGLKTFILKGHVTDHGTRTSLDGCAIVLRNSKGRTFTSLTDSSGYFTVKLPVDNYNINTSYIGFKPFTKNILIKKNDIIRIEMSQIAIPLKEVMVKTSPMLDEFNNKGATSLLSISDNDPFAQINSLPGISGTSVGGNLNVNGGQSDENLILMDGIGIYHSHHNNSLLAQFNGETVKKVSFYDSFIPAQYEGRLSSVTDVKIKEGDSINHHQVIGLDLPSASLTFDGPIIKNKLTYMMAGRHSWIDFMEDLFSKNPRSNRSFADVIGKLKYRINDQNYIEGLVYTSKDQFNDTIDNIRNQNVLEWKNKLYSISFHTTLPKGISSTSTVAYTEYANKIYAPIINIMAPIFINEGMKKYFVKSDFTKKLDDFVDLSWGLKFTQERYNLLASKDTVENNFQNITQLSSYINSKIKISNKLYGSAALNLVTYLPKNNVKFFSIQPRFTLKYIQNSSNLFSFDFSRMEQFYHNISLGEIPLPTDLRMPSIDGFKPSSSIHCEIGWKHLKNNWRTSISTFYKRRYNILGVRYNVEPEEEGWNRFIMRGNAASYGIKIHSISQWNKWLFNLSYTFARSYEWFQDYNENKRCPTLHDVPHIFHCGTSYNIGAKSFFSLGGYIKSGIFENIFYEDSSPSQIINSRARKKFNYRLDFNYSNSTTTKNEKLNISYKIGLFNIIGNPKNNEIIDLYSVETKKHCLPYFTLKLRF